MALIGCKQIGSVETPKVHQKVAPLTQEIALVLHSSIRTSMAFQKEKKEILKILLRLSSIVLVEMWKQATDFFLESYCFEVGQSASPGCGSPNSGPLN